MLYSKLDKAGYIWLIIFTVCIYGLGTNVILNQPCTTGVPNHTLAVWLVLLACPAHMSGFHCNKLLAQFTVSALVGLLHIISIVDLSASCQYGTQQGFVVAGALMTVWCIVHASYIWNLTTTHIIQYAVLLEWFVLSVLFVTIPFFTDVNQVVFAGLATHWGITGLTALYSVSVICALPTSYTTRLPQLHITQFFGHTLYTALGHVTICLSGLLCLLLLEHSDIGSLVQTAVIILHIICFCVQQNC